MQLSFATPSRITKPSSGRRCYNKCNYCRGKKCKCLPQNRNWALGEKCEACERGGQPCGPNERFERHSGRTPASILGEEGFSQPLIHQASPPSNVASPELCSANFRQFGHHPDAVAIPVPPPQTDDGWSNAIDGIPPANQNYDFAPLFDESMHFDGPGGNLVSPGAGIPPKSLVGLKRLGALHMLYEYQHDWKKAIPCDFKTLDKDNPCPRLENSVGMANWVVETAFRETLTGVVDSAQESFGLPRELILRRALTAVERFEKVAKRRGFIDGAQKIHSTILRHLITLAQAQDDTAEVTRFQGELSILNNINEGHGDTDLNETLAQSLQDSARLACDVLWNLNMPPEVRNTLAFTRQTTLRTMHRAMHAGFEEVARSLSSDGNEADSLLPDVLKRSLAHVAVETGSLKLLPSLIKKKPDLLHSRDALHRTPILIAAAKGDLAAYDILFKAGAKIHVRDKGSRSVLNHACASGSFKMVERLLKGGADVNSDVFGVSSPLCEAASRGHYEICLLLLEQGDCVNHLSEAAELAEKNGHHTVATLLQQNKALYSEPGLSLLRDGLSSRSSNRSTPLYTMSDPICDDLISPPQPNPWELGVTFDMPYDPSHSPSSEPMFETPFDSTFGSTS